MTSEIIMFSGMILCHDDNIKKNFKLLSFVFSSWHICIQEDNKIIESDDERPQIHILQVAGKILIPLMNFVLWLLNNRINRDQNDQLFVDW